MICVDPFNYFKVSTMIPDTVKKTQVYPINTLMYSAIEFVHDPTPNVIIGDSRSERFSTDYLSERTGKPFKNLSAKGGKLNEIADMFWLVNEHVKLENVYIVLNFNIYNGYAYADHVKGLKCLISNPLLYLFDRAVAEASFLVLKNSMSSAQSTTEIQNMSKEAFWTWTVNTRAAQQYGKWKYPDDGYSRLRKISAYCKNKGIKLSFIIVPLNSEYQQKVTEFKLDGAQSRFNRDIGKLALTYDYDYSSDLSRNKDNFGDPLHITMKVGNDIIDEIVDGKFKYGRILPNN